MNKPIIAVTIGEKADVNYIQAIEDAGGQPVCLDTGYMRSHEIGEILDRIDGLLLTGGRDIHPSHYDPDFDQSKLKEFNISLDEDRDAYEIPLTHAAYERGMPIFGICRGFQVLNVVLGGRLIEDIRTDVRHTSNENGESARHAVEVDPQSRLAGIIPIGLKEVNSRHHQGVSSEELSDHLRVAAYSPKDGIIEAVEATKHPWALAVQWHPERQDDAYIYEPCKVLFRELVAVSNHCD